MSVKRRGDTIVKKGLLRATDLLIGLTAGLMVGLLLPAEAREKLSLRLAAGLSAAQESMPDG